MDLEPASPSPAPAAPERWAAKFFTIWTGQVFSLIGSALVQFALVWWLTRQTGSATILATSSLVALLPQIFLGPFVGALVDRWNRRLIMIVADTAIAAATGVLLLLFWSGHVQVWHIYVILFIRSLGGAFHHPAMTASTSLMVPHKHLTRISGLNQLLQGFLSIFAPPLGALLISIMPTQGVLAIDIGTAALAVLPLLFVHIPQPPRQAARENGSVQKTSYWHDLREGFRYVVKWPGLLGLILLAMLLNFLLSPSVSLLPLLVMREFKGGAAELAWVESVFGVGVIAGGLALSAWGGFKRRILTSFLGIVGLGVGVILTGLAPANLFWLLLAANFLIGFMQVLANGPIGAIFQSTIEPDYQGRVFSLIGAGATAMMPLSLLIAGPVSDWLGVRVWYVFGGAVCILTTIAAAFIPAIMNIEQNKPAAPVEAAKL
ncbi:MAG: MFS transporter DHA3 family macrolide efflux protein [Anaerolineaceae bacterium]|nr:MAG: MFS transporter DHA3 family macrolide efflux protein [Anaerolineaceae bacterium]